MLCAGIEGVAIMSGATLPYHLRPNKAVDRLLFVDLLARLDSAVSIADNYEYVGLGGFTMEEFRMIHERFYELPLKSLEENRQVERRARFNAPNSRVIFRRQPAA